jgi:integrase
MHVVKPADRNAWEAVYTDHTGRRVRKSTGCTDKRSAMVRLKSIMAEVEEQRRADVTEAQRRASGVEEITLEAALGLYVSSLSTQGKASAYDSAGLMRKAIGKMEPRKPHPKRGIGSRLRPALYVEPKAVEQRWHLDGDMPFAKLTPRHLEELIQARRKEGMSATTIGHELKLLRAAARFCGGLSYAVPKIENWRLPKTVHKTRYLSAQEFAAVLKALEPSEKVNGMVAKHREEAKDLLVVLVMTGGRWSEIASLKWSRVNWDEETVTLWGNKTQKERAIPLPQRALEVLRRRWQAEGRHAVYVFPSRDGEGPRKSQCRPISDAIDRAGLNGEDSVRENGRATIHSLRHTYASWLLAGGADLSDVQDALGHTTLNMTRRYAHLSRAQSIKRLGVAMGNTLEQAGLAA